MGFLDSTLPTRTVEPSGWGYRWTVARCGPVDPSTGWTFTPSGAMRKSSYRYATEMEHWLRSRS